MKYNTRSITIKVDSIYKVNPVGMKSNSNTIYEAKATEEEAIALAILVGKEYNKYGQHIEVEKVHKLQNKFDEILQEMKELSIKNKSK